MTSLSAKPLGDDEFNLIEVISYSRLVDETKFNIDQMPLLAARISTARESKTGANEENDAKLLSFLAEHKHLTPFEHQTVTFRVVAPLFVLREWHRHRTQSYNEMSMRYTSDPVGKCYLPKVWRRPSPTNKQGSSNEPFSIQDAHDLTSLLYSSYRQATNNYKFLVEKGVARELARLVVPVGNYSEMYATANLRNWHAFWKLRASPDAQWEIRQYALAIDNLLSFIFPKTWEALKCYA